MIESVIVCAWVYLFRQAVAVPGVRFLGLPFPVDDRVSRQRKDGKKIMFKKFFLILAITGTLLSSAGVKKISLDLEAVAYLDAGVVSDLEDLEAVEHMYE